MYYKHIDCSHIDYRCIDQLTDDVVLFMSLKETFRILIHILMNVFPQGTVDNNFSLIDRMAQHWTGDDASLLKLMVMSITDALRHCSY